MLGETKTMKMAWWLANNKSIVGLLKMCGETKTMLWQGSSQRKKTIGSHVKSKAKRTYTFENARRNQHNV